MAHKKNDSSARVRRITRPIQHIVVHCSETNDIHSAKELMQMYEDEERPPFGFHFIVDELGNVQTGIDVAKVGYHCSYPGIEYSGIAVCYLGGKQEVSGEIIDTRTDAQMVALRAVVSTLKTMFPDAEISGHNNWDRKAKCPGYDARREYADIDGLPLK